VNTKYSGSQRSGGYRHDWWPWRAYEEEEREKRDKHIKEFLDENLRAPPLGDGDDDGDAEPTEAPDDSEKDEDTSSQEQIAKLRFEQGRSKRDPPEGVKNKSYPLFSKHNTPRGGMTLEYECNFFKGMKVENTIFDMQLNPA
jgi:hypothetical protein